MLNKTLGTLSHSLLGAVLISTLTQLAYADTGSYFVHKDWELACDNTGMCRAAGYQSDAQFGQSVSLLISRPAGAGGAVLTQLQIEEDLVQNMEANLSVGATSLGRVTFDAHKSTAKLSSAQSTQLLKALVGAEDIRLTTQAQQWQISTAGANAVLLKMDDIQKRVNTPNAIYQKGNQSEQNVLQPKAIPKIGITGYRPAVASHFAVDSKNAHQLFKKLKAKTDEQDCPNLYEARFFEDDRVSVYPLNAEQVVVQVPCWRGAYNEGLGYWVMDKALQKIQQQVTTSGSSFSEAQIFSEQKGRGIADCGIRSEWAWNGQAFVLSYQAQSQQCKGFAGGAWNLPTYVAIVARTD